LKRQRLLAPRLRWITASLSFPTNFLQFILMAPSRIEQSTDVDEHNAELATLGVKAIAKQSRVNDAAQSPPVADDYMYDFKYNHPLPTTDVLGVEFPKDCNAQAEADGIVKRLSDALGSSDPDAFTEMFLEHGEIASQSHLSQNFH
jgi:hypothetical protein